MSSFEVHPVSISIGLAVAASAIAVAAVAFVALSLMHQIRLRRHLRRLRTLPLERLRR